VHDSEKNDRARRFVDLLNSHRTDIIGVLNFISITDLFQRENVSCVHFNGTGLTINNENYYYFYLLCYYNNYNNFNI